MSDGSNINPVMCRKVADAIENRSVEGLAFFMPSYINTDFHAGRQESVSPKDHACKSSACIAGWTRIVDGTFNTPQSMGKYADMMYSDFDDGIYKDGTDRIHEGAANSLGLDSQEASDLFLGFMDATDKQAVAHLRDIAEGEPVDWRRYRMMDDEGIKPLSSSGAAAP